MLGPSRRSYFSTYGGLRWLSLVAWLTCHSDEPSPRTSIPFAGCIPVACEKILVLGLLTVGTIERQKVLSQAAAIERHEFENPRASAQSDKQGRRGTILWNAGSKDIPALWPGRLGRLALVDSRTC